MTRNPLEALLRLRRVAADEARRGLAECLRVEGEAAAAVAAIAAAIERETEVATSLAAGDAEVEAFAPGSGGSVQSSNRRWAEEQPRRRRCRPRDPRRGGQPFGRPKLLEQHAAAARLETQRREQRDIDEAAERRGDG
jgi:hypothetical protein